MNRLEVPAILTLVAGFCGFLYLILGPIGANTASRGVITASEVFMGLWMILICAVLYYVVAK
jgi:mannose/fructose/N-acetylgalactosamine-specific phosphotransferase system component IID